MDCKILRDWRQFCDPATLDDDADYHLRRRQLVDKQSLAMVIPTAVKREEVLMPPQIRLNQACRSGSHQGKSGLLLSRKPDPLMPALDMIPSSSV
jgi:hypothetical protein